MLLINGEAQPDGWRSLYGSLFCINDCHYLGVLGAEWRNLHASIMFMVTKGIWSRCMMDT